MSNQANEQELLIALQQSATIIQRHKKALAAYHEPIAIIGMACRYPGAVGSSADTPEQFWQNLLAGYDAISELPAARAVEFPPEEILPGGYLPEVDHFDPAFFGLAPREAVVMDPQHRLLLETTWEALEAANVVPVEWHNQEVGVFVGIEASEYIKYCVAQSDDFYTGTGNASSAAAGRISYLLGLTGPCVAIDTACSSSLVAVHLACQSLRNGECSAAIAGGVNLILDLEWTSLFISGNMLSADARCKTFDAAANGYVRGEGCGIVVLKRLADTLADADPIVAVIRGTAVNQDGPSGGLTVPNGPSQERVIRRALDDAKVAPEEIGYIEAHGSGTPLGDPIEMGALSAVFAGRRTPLYVGSVKTNIGHLEVAAGVAGLMKLVLALQHGVIPPLLHLQTPNPHIDWASAPVQVPTETTPWQRLAAGAPRIGGVSSFGFSGTNAHLVVTEAPVREKAVNAVERPVHLFTLAAKQEAALTAYAQRYLTFLAAHPDLDLADLCYTAHVGRSHFAQRLSIAATSAPQLHERLAAYLATGDAVGLSRGTVVPQPAPPQVAFLFTGQGSQYVDMGRGLYATEPTFRATLDRCEALYQAETGESLLAVMYPETTMDDGRWTMEQPSRGPSGRVHQPSSLDDTTYTQPALFALEYALATLWQSWGIQPSVLIGHSVGEIVAACVAGVFSLEDAIKLVAARGRLMGALPYAGAMVSLQTDEAQVRTAIAPYAGQVSIAAVNGAESIVIAGQAAAVLAIADSLAADGIKTRRLTVSHAFHSPLMDPMLEAFARVAEGISYYPPMLPLVSNVTGGLADGTITTPAYWVRHARDTVRFADGMATVLAQGATLLLEIGSKPTLLGMVQSIWDSAPAGSAIQKPILLPSLRQGQSDWQLMVESLGVLYVHGAAIDWHSVDRNYQRHKVLLPTYPFQRQRYWATESQAHTHAAKDDFAQWLARHTIEELTTLVTDNGEFALHERAIVAKVLTTLESAQRTQALNAQIEEMLYAVAWQPLQSLAPVSPPSSPGRWLILTPSQQGAAGVGEQLATQLCALSETVECFAVETDLHTIIDTLTSASDEPPLRGIVHLWGLDDTPCPDGATLIARQQRNLDSLLQIVQTLAAGGRHAAAPRLWVVTQGAQQLAPTETVAVTQTPLWGLGRVIALEHGELWGGLIDIDTTTPPQTFVAELLQSQADGETQVAYRQGVRYGARLVRSTLPPQRQPAVTIQPDATYLITGGLGGLGLLVAAWLADQGAKQLVLIGRRGITTTSQQAAVDGLMAQGVTVHVAQVDVSDEAAMRALFTQLTADELPLKGVIHTAGLLDDAILLNQQWERFAPVLASKVTGGWLLHQLTAHLDLDFMVFFSSLAALMGNPGQGNYAAANAFLDGLACYRRQQGLPALSINWGAWAEAGMAVRGVQLASLNSQSITPPVGMRVLAQLLGGAALSPIAVALIDWAQVAQSSGLPQRFYSNFVTAAPSTAPPQAHLVQELARLPVNRRVEALRRYLQETVGHVLGLPDLPETTTGFAELGMDSLMSLELRRHLERNLDCPLTTTVVFDYPTIEKLASHLLDLLVTGDQRLEAAPASSLQPPVSHPLQHQDEPIAIISLACRFPGADTPEQFWQLLQAGADLVQEVPATRWSIGDFYDPQRPAPGKMYMREAAFLERVDQFDPLFFGIAPREAVGMDPQHRLLLEVSWETLERAGLAQQTLVNSQTGVFVGIGPGDYGIMRGVNDLGELDTYLATNNGHSMAAGRLAYTLGLQGPTLAVDTACSSSLVALHLACQSLRLGECELALAGGVNLILAPLTHIALSQMQALATDGRCKTFDAAADGYGRGEGCGVVLLKRLSNARRDGDTIWAVIKGSAVNHDGASSGLTVPNRHAQVKLLHQALASAGVAPDDLAYVEAHGTGTVLGDPIEVAALSEVFGNARSIPLLVGSVKTNVGHLEAAAGIVGFMKTVLALHHGQIPPHLHFHTPNPYIAWDQVAIRVATERQPWPQPVNGQPTMAGISSFGLSGTNAHIVVAAAEEGRQESGEDRLRQGRTRYLLPLSAKSNGALPALAGQYGVYLAAQPAIDLGDLCYTAAVGRNHFNQRVAIIAHDRADLQAKLAALHNGDKGAGVCQGSVTSTIPHIAFLFTGQGAQSVNMGRTLYETEPTFRATLDRCEELYRAETGESLLAVLYPETGDRGQRTEERKQEADLAEQGAINHLKSKIDDTTYTQPALFVLEVALAQLWQSWGIQPDLLIGHSVGEVAAACVAGVFSLEDGLKLIAARGRLMGALPQDGAMIAVTADEGRVAAAIAAYYGETIPVTVSIAAVNGPENLVISGQWAAVTAIAEHLAAAGIKTRQLTVSHAFHSPLMEPMLAAFQQVAESITYHSPALRLISNVTGQLASAEVTMPAYWVRHVREAVRFGEGIATLYAEGIDTFLEIGPKPVLLGMVEPILDGVTSARSGHPVTQSPPPPVLLPSLREGQDDWQQMLMSLGELYVRGVAIDWASFEQGYQRHKVLVPTYPFQRQRYWIEEDPTHGHAAKDAFAQWLATNGIDALTTRLTQRGKLTTSEQGTVTKALQLLAAEQHAQQMAAAAAALLYEVAWERQPKPADGLPSDAAGHWLLWGGEGTISAAVTEQLTAFGATVEPVQTATELAAFCARLADRNHTEQPWRGILHLWALTHPPLADADCYTATNLMQRQERNLGSVVQLLQRLAAQPTTTVTPRLWVVTQGAQRVTATDAVAIDQTPLWGLGRTVTLEHGDLWGGLIDLDPTATPAAAAQAILAELLQPANSSVGSEEQVAYRGGERYVARLVPSPPLPGATPLSIHADGAYLITGGLGYLGLQTARWLVEQGARHLILTGRRGVQRSEQQALLAALQAQGAVIQIATVDVADEAAMTHLFDELATRATPLRGIIHQAGVLGYQPVQSLSWDELAAVLRPKVVGGWLLHRLSANFDLDFFLCYSSGAAIWGSKQQAHYGAANHFLDGLIAYRRQLGLPGLSIAWGPWGGAEGEGGMATPEAQALLLAMGVRALTPEQALAIQGYLLQTTASQITVADVDWARLKALYELTKPRRFLAQLATTPAADVPQADPTTATRSLIVQQVQALPANQRLAALAQHVSATVSQVLGLGNQAATLAPTTGFTELGMDSLMALEIRRALEGSLHCTLPATIAFEYPTVEALTAYLLQTVLALAPPPSTRLPTSSEQRLVINEPLAVISMACRFPGADTPEAFWQLLQGGADLIGEMPDARWDVEEFYSPQHPVPGKMYTRNAAFIEGVEGFDPLFFGIAPREAASMDPHHRLLLEITWELLERAAIAPGSLVDSQTGVFVGISASDYGAMADQQTLANLDTYAVTSSSNSAATGRLAYTLGLQGPTMAVDTACSSSLVALHLACQSLRTGECDLALAGGISLMLSPLGHIALSQIQSLAPDGRCKTFDASADGYGRGEGAGLVLLKRLSDAERDGDTILAVIKGTAVNHDGPSSGLTVPNKRAQEKLIRQALANAQLTPDDIGYLEAHGTGTSLGDPIEIRAVGAVFGAERAQPLLIGSVKTNMGHLEQAAGIAGFMKTVLALQHRQVPPHLHFQTPNPYIEWDEYALAVPTQLQPWPQAANQQPLLAGVSAFGISGTNAHVIVAAGREDGESGDWETEDRGQRREGRRQRAEGRGEKIEERPVHLLAISAKSAGALTALAAHYAAYLQAQPELDLGDLCYTALVGRNHFARRVAIVGANRDELQAKLAALAVGEQGAQEAGLLQGTAPTNQPRLAFLFTGQGAQYVGMGRQLYETQPAFRTVIDRCDVVAQAVLGRSLVELLYPATPPDHNDLMESHPCGQAVNFAVECALVEVWKAWGIQPDLVLGHSLGDFAAAYAAGVLSLEDGLRLVSARGRLMEQAVGSMVSVMGSEAEVAPFVEPYADVVIGVINGPRSVVISGAHDPVHAATTALKTAGFKTRKVAVPMAAHSPLLDPVLDEFETLIRETITLHPPQRPVVSSMTGKLVTAELTDPAYWRHHLRNPVRFVEGVTTLAAEGATIFIEIGPKPTLLGMVEPILDQVTRHDTSHPLTQAPAHLVMLSSLRQHEDDWRQMLTSLGELYVRGVAIDWAGFDQLYQRHKVLLPTYPFQRERYWIESPKSKRSAARLRPLIDKMIKSPSLKATLFETALSAENLPFLTDHRVYGTIVAPGACHLAMVLSAAELAFVTASPHDTWRYTISDLIFPQALAVEDDETRTAQVIFTPGKRNGAGPHADFELTSFAPAQHAPEELPALIHATGKVAMMRQEQAETLSLPALQARFTQPMIPLPADEAMAQGQNTPLHYGPAFCWLEAAWSQPEQSAGQGAPAAVLARFQQPAAIATVAGYPLHPGLLDSCFQTTSLARTTRPQGELYLPFAVETLHLTAAAEQSSSATWWCYTEQVDTLQWNLWIFTDAGHLVATIRGFQLRAASPTAIQTGRLRTDWLYALAWTPTALPPTERETAAPDGWLIFGSPTGVGGALASALTAHCPGATLPAVLVQPGSRFAVDATQQATIDPTDPAHFAQLLAHVATCCPAPNATVGVVYLWGLEQTLVAEEVAHHALRLTGGLLHLTQALLAAQFAARLWVVTQGCQIIPQAPPLVQGEQDKTASLIAAAMGTLWGLGRTIGRELPLLQTVCIDLERGDTLEQQINWLQEELWSAPAALPPADDPLALQVAYHSGTRYVATLEPWPAPQPMAAAHPMRVQFNDYGGPEQIALAPMTRRQPGPGEVEVEVKAAGLNFRDVLNMLGMMKEFYAALGITQAKDVMVGLECAGVVTAVGDSVTTLAVGERVMGLGLGERTFASFVTVPAEQMTHIPDHLSDVEAATIPLTFLTAWYGLVELAKLQPGERVLIHAASGGVGQAAVQIAQAIGAEVIATASPGKWALLQRQGVTHILNSRTLDFATEVRQITAGRGVDIVLNSLNGDFIEQSLATLSQGGRFVEMGKLGIWSHAQVAAARPDATYYPFDLGEEILSEPALQTRLWAAVTARLQTKALQPLPYRTFPVQEAAAAFRYMQQAKQFGKLILTFPPQPPVLRSDATYLITGGLGALGLEAAKQLVTNGAKHLVLAGRRGVTTDEQHTALAQLAEAGATIQVVSADMGDGAAVAALVETCQQIAPLRGIIHAAGLLDDGIVPAQTLARLAKVMRPKVDGTWHLHTATQGLALDFFVCFSSSSALLGSPGQSNYTAANAFMDLLMQQRRQHGLPGLSINWGPWAEVGLAVGLEERMQAQGLTMIAPQQGRQLLHYLLQLPVAQVGVVPLQAQPVVEPVAQPHTLPLRTILAELPSQERPAHLEAFVRSMIAAVLGLRDSSALETDTRLFDFGLDSLMAVELKNKLAAGLDCSLRATLLFDYPTLDVLLPHLLHDVLQFADEATAPPVDEQAEELAQITAVQELSQEDLLALLNAEIEDIL